MSSRVSARTLALSVCAAVWLLLALAGGARADVFGGATLLSADTLEQAEYAHDPAASEDGRYVVFDGSVGGVPGVWRRETRPGATLEQVAGGNATMPSISADGQYVSFTTNQGASLASITDGEIPVGTPHEEAPSVYVRDMSKSQDEEGAFTLVSAKNHSAQSLSYEFPGADPEQAETDSTTLGAVEGSPSAISADGNTVVFITTAQSDLAGPGTPPLQVAVRRLSTQETELVSVRYEPATGKLALDEAGDVEPVPLNESGYGAVDVPETRSFSPRLGEDQLERGRKNATLPGASISADGSTVTWLGQNLPAQARTLSEEAPKLQFSYAEPLWRRIAAGSSEPSRRVTGGPDPEDPECAAAPEPKLPAGASTTDPCQGPFATQETGGLGTRNNALVGVEYTPRLSADGDDVAFIASAKLASERAFVIGAEEFNSDAYWVDMRAPDHKAGLVQLTQFASSEKDVVSTNAEVTDIAISPDGRQVAFTTMRTVFPLADPAYVSLPAAVPGLGELFDADLANDTLTRVTEGYEGGAPQHPETSSPDEDPYGSQLDGALRPSFADHGDAIVFSDTASNLVYGDGNSPPNEQQGHLADGADVFLVPRLSFDAEPTLQTISPAPPNPSPEEPWRITVSASSLSDGDVLVRVTVPAAGTLTVSASSRLSTKVRNRVRRVTRPVAHASRTARAQTTIVLRLEPAARYGKLPARTGGLPGTLTVSFTARGHSPLRRTLAVRFARKAAKRKAKRG